MGSFLCPDTRARMCSLAAQLPQYLSRFNANLTTHRHNTAPSGSTGANCCYKRWQWQAHTFTHTFFLSVPHACRKFAQAMVFCFVLVSASAWTGDFVNSQVA